MKPGELDAEHLYGEAQELARSGENGAALKAFGRLCAEYPPDPRFLIAFAALLQSLGHWEPSIEKFLQGLAPRPHYCEGDARLMLAQLYLQSGRKAKALKQWRTVAAMPLEYPSYDAVPDEAKRKLREHAV